MEIRIKKHKKTPCTALCELKIIKNNNLNFISTFNPGNPKKFNLRKFGANTLVENKVKSIKLIHAKQQPSYHSCKTTTTFISKKVLTNSLFTNQRAGILTLRTYTVF